MAVNKEGVRTKERKEFIVDHYLASHAKELPFDETIRKLTSSFEEPVYSKRNLRLVSSPFGRIVAFEGVREERGACKDVITVVTGVYCGDLAPLNGLRRMDVEPIPLERRAVVSRILRQEGYSNLMSFW